MEKPHPIGPEPPANRTWEHLEDFVREQVQQFIQALLEEEVTGSYWAARSPPDGRPLTQH
jgi:hypothetical protein